MKNCFPIVSLGLALTLTGFPVHSADDEEDEKGYIEEVIVTAEKREENLLDVPVTLTAFSAQMIEELGMTNQDDLEQMVPGLQFQDEGQLTGQGTTIRGIGTRLAGETHPDLAVATYVDGVYTLGVYGDAPNMFDLERVEVARGPQRAHSMAGTRLPDRSATTPQNPPTSGIFWSTRSSPTRLRSATALPSVARSRRTSSSESTVATTRVMAPRRTSASATTTMHRIRSSSHRSCVSRPTGST